MRRVILSKTVVTLCLEIKIALITCWQNFFQVFVLKERGCFSNTRWNRVCANVGANIFPRLWNMFIHFCASEERHFGEVDRPAIRWILQLWFTGNTRINIFARRLVVFFSSRVDPIPIWIDNVLIMARIYILFNPFFKKKNDSFKFRIILASKPDANSTCAESAKFEWHEILPHLFTNNAFVFKPFNESPRHLNQNRSSSFFKLAGSLPASEEPGISSSVKALAAITWRSKQTGKNHAEDWLASLPRY